MPPEQFRFRRFHSTVQQIKRIQKHVKDNFTLQRSTVMVLLDIEKAFDTVWHNGLIFKLINFNFPYFLIKVIRSFLSERSFCICLDNEYSDILNISAGVPQGSVLGPILYTIFCADIPKYEVCNYAYYADDTAIYVSYVLSENILQNGIKSIEKFSILGRDGKWVLLPPYLRKISWIFIFLSSFTIIVLTIIYIIYH